MVLAVPALFTVARETGLLLLDCGLAITTIPNQVFQSRIYRDAAKALSESWLHKNSGFSQKLEVIQVRSRCLFISTMRHMSA